MRGCCSWQRRMQCFWSCCHGHCRKHRKGLWLLHMLAWCSPASADVLHPVRQTPLYPNAIPKQLRLGSRTLCSVLSALRRGGTRGGGITF